jgi:ubiquitin-protein ligase
VGTPYEGGIFKCKLVIENDFPQKPPKGKSLAKLIFIYWFFNLSEVVKKFFAYKSINNL